MEKSMIIKGICLSLLLPFVFVSCKSDNEPESKPDYDNAWYREIDNVVYVYNERYDYATVDTAYNAKEIRILPYVKLRGEDRPVASISDYAFKDNTVEKLYIPSNIKRFGSHTFENTNVRELYIEDLAEWSETDFYGYGNPLNRETTLYVAGTPVTDILEIPEGVKVIGDYAFSRFNCRKIVVPQGATKIGWGAFSNSTVSEIVLPETLEKFDAYAFWGCDNLSKLHMPDSFVKYEGMYNVGSECFPKNLSEIYVNSLETWVNIKYYYYITDKWGLIGYSNPFERSYDLYIDGELAEDITIPGNVKYIYPYAFSRSTIRSFVAEEGLETLDNEVLSECQFLEKVSLPSTLQILSTSFTGCDNLRELELKCLNPPAYWNSFFYLNKDVLANCTLYVPKGSLEAYRANEWWGQFKNIVEI